MREGGEEVREGGGTSAVYIINEEHQPIDLQYCAHNYYSNMYITPILCSLSFELISVLGKSLGVHQ